MAPIEPGEFPFPLTGGREESPYLTWLRNHSNYMTPRGLFDYLRAAGVLARGMIINFLIFLPYLLLVAIGLAYSHHWMREHPFQVTFGVLGLAAAWILLFPLAVPIFRIAAYNRSVETGSESTVKQRDLYERSFGALLLAALAAAAFEFLPWALEFFHDRLQLAGLGWKGGLATASAGLALLGGANRLLSALDGVKQKVAMVLVGILGLLVPLIVILSATDYLLYGLPPSLLWMFSPLAVSVVGVVGITIGILLGLRRKAFRTSEVFAILGLLALGVVLAVTVVALSALALVKGFERGDDMERTLQQLEEMAAQFENVTDKQGMTPEVVDLIDAFVSARRNSMATTAELETLGGEPAGTQAGDDGRGLRRLWGMETSARASRRLLSSKLPFVALGGMLSTQSDEALAKLRRDITALAHRQLLQRLTLLAEGEDRAAALLRRALVEHHLSSLPDTLDPVDPGRDDDRLRVVRDRFEILVADSAHHRAIDDARASSQKWTVSEIATLVSEEDLARTVAAKFKDVPGKADTARLAGKAELAALLTKQELLDLAFPAGERARRELLAQTQRRWFLDEALPRFPEAGAPDYEKQLDETARALAELAQLGPAVKEVGLRENSVAFFYSTRALLRPEEESPPLGAVVAGDPTAEEVGRAAGQRMARRALEDLDVDHLRALAFGLSVDETGSGGLEEARGKADERKLREFLELEKQPLEALAAVALSPLPAGTHLPDPEVWNQLPYELPDPYRRRVVLAARALGHDTDAVAGLARVVLIERALSAGEPPTVDASERRNALDGFATHSPDILGDDELARIAAARFWGGDPAAPDELVAKLMFGVHGRLDRDGLSKVKRQFSAAVMLPKVIFVSLLAAVIWLGCWLTVDVNLTSIHGLYRDRLASAFLVGRDTRGDIDIEDDIDLADLCRYEARSTAPYHLVNVALNLQGSKDPGIRGRQSGFFIFSKRFVGGPRTGYCRSETLEEVFPQMDLATAMAISAAAAAPNMGRATSPFLVAFMTLLNVRLGYWAPNPGFLEERRGRLLRERRGGGPRRATAPPGFTFHEVFAEELREIESRWGQLYPEGARRLAANHDGSSEPTVRHGLVGIGFSGGGIRSASVNLGIAQALHQRGVFDHLDYMSTVSGGGYLGASISTLMRSREKLFSEIAGTVAIERRRPGATDEQVVIVAPSEAGETKRTYRFSGRATLNVRHGEKISAGTPLLKPRMARGRSDIAGTVTVEGASTGERLLRVQGGPSSEHRDYRFSRFDSVVVKTGDVVKAGDRLIRRHDTVGGRFRWRVRPVAFLREMLSRLDESHRWVNLSDGGHIENLAAIELLRRRCKYIIIGDGEEDSRLHFAGLATLMRYAQIDLGILIDIDLDPIRLRPFGEDENESPVSGAHWTLGTITYPPLDGGGPPETGWLLYLKSSFTGDEGEVIREYRHRDPAFPHQSTGDQFFDEDQFEAYRALGQHIAEGALRESDSEGRMSFGDFEEWFARLRKEDRGGGAPASA